MCPKEHIEKFKTDIRSSTPALSMLFYANVEYFYQIGGFANIAKRISQIPAKEMNLMKHMVLPLSQVCSSFPPLYPPSPSRQGPLGDSVGTFLRKMRCNPLLRK